MLDGAVKVLIKDRQSLPSGFTLIELLVVLAIIAVLATLSAAGLAKAKRRVDLTVCQGKLRQISLALQLYTSDSGIFPQAMGDSEPAWIEALVPYTGERWPESDFDPLGPIGLKPQRLGLYMCPGYRKVPGLFLRTYRGPWGGGYAYNMGGTGIFHTRCWGLGQIPGESPIREGSVLNPARMLALGDAPLGAGGIDSMVLGFLRLDSAINERMGVSNALPAFEGILKKRHLALWNTFFVDGHLEAQRTERLLNRKEPELLRRWNRDDLPHAEDLRRIPGF